MHVDLRVVGRYELMMIDRQNGTRYPLRYEIIELVVPELLVLRCPALPEMGMPHDVLTRVELHDHGDKTRMTSATDRTRHQVAVRQRPAGTPPSRSSRTS